MDRAVDQWKKELHEPISALEEAALKKQLSKSFTLYGSMLLLANSLLDSDAWNNLHNRDVSHCRDLLQCIARCMKVSHIAVSTPIPPNNQSGSENVVRSPSNFIPLFGDFGPESCEGAVTPEDFDKAYWTTAKQNGISQTWAPRWTMFSRGNISEKARILELPSVRQAVVEGRLDRGCAAVDLYAGIGYFTFSYLKAGVSKVLGWDLNPWSIEGIMRGAAANKWPTIAFDDQTNEAHMAKDEARLLVFNESNEHAAARVSLIRKDLPPIRHVNCGLLPTSKDSWETAFAVVDPERGGWVHIHENFDQREITQKGEEVREEFQRMFLRSATSKSSAEVVLEHINRVKTYAPGVYHVVLDIYVPPHAGA